MDQKLLARTGIRPSSVRLGFIDGYRLRIGERATLAQHRNSRVYGAMMEIASDDVAKLYAEDSVADYLPEAVMVELEGGTQVEATCYILPNDKVTGTNKNYAKALSDVAGKLGLPEPYVDQIRQSNT